MVEDGMGGQAGRDDNRRDAETDDLGITRLSESLDRFVGHLGAPPISVLTQLHDRWPELVGPGLSAATRPVELIDGVLTVACNDAAWASQIGWMEGQIITRFRSMFGSVELHRVSTRIGQPPSDEEMDKTR